VGQVCSGRHKGRSQEAEKQKEFFHVGFVVSVVAALKDGG
jgi:hypothetical protein